VTTTLKQTVRKQFYILLNSLILTNCSFHITKGLYIHHKDSIHFRNWKWKTTLPLFVQLNNSVCIQTILKADMCIIGTGRFGICNNSFALLLHINSYTNSNQQSPFTFYTNRCAYPLFTVQSRVLKLQLLCLLLSWLFKQLGTCNILAYTGYQIAGGKSKLCVNLFKKTP
jgi:hypothetical protein